MTREAADRLMRMLVFSTVLGVVVLVVLALVISEQRGLLLAIAGIYLITSVAADLTVRRTLNRQVAQAERRRIEGGGDADELTGP